MPRRYKVTFEKVAVSAVQDLVTIFGASGKMLRIIRTWVDCVDVTAPTNQQLALRCSFVPATLGGSSGGSTPTPAKIDQGDAAASFTAHANDTTKATSSGTIVKIEENGANVFAGWDYMWPSPPPIGPSQAFVFELITAPTGTLTLSGGCEVEEIGG